MFQQRAQPPIRERNKSKLGAVNLKMPINEHITNVREPVRISPLVPSHAELTRAIWQMKRSGRWQRAIQQPYRSLLNLLGRYAERQWQEEFLGYPGWPQDIRTQLNKLPEKFITIASIQPDIACRLFELLREARCEVIVECGSGISTIIIALAIGKRPITFISLEESEHWLGITRKALQEFGLLDRVRLIHSALTPIEVNGKKTEAHDDSAVANHQVDVLLVDAPPARVGRMGVLPRMAKHLRPGALVLLDDAARDGEEECVQTWVKKDLASLEGYLALGTGLAVLRTK